MHDDVRWYVPAEECLAKKTGNLFCSNKFGNWHSMAPCVHDVRIPAFNYFYIFSNIILPYIFKGYRVKNITNCITFLFVLFF